MTLTAELAREVLSESAKLGIYEGSQELDDDAGIAAAEGILKNARSAAKSSPNNPLVRAVLVIVGEASEAAPIEAVSQAVKDADAAERRAALDASDEERKAKLNAPLPNISMEQAQAIYTTAKALGINSDDALLVAQNAVGLELTALVAMPSSTFPQIMTAITEEMTHRASGGTWTTKEVPVTNGTYSNTTVVPELSVPNDPVPVQPTLWDRTVDAVLRFQEKAGVSNEQLAEVLATQYNGAEVFSDLTEAQLNDLAALLAEAAGEPPWDQEPEPVIAQGNPVGGIDPDPNPYPPATEAPVEKASRTRRVRASNGELVAKADLDAYEAALAGAGSELPITHDEGTATEWTQTQAEIVDNGDGTVTALDGSVVSAMGTFRDAAPGHLQNAGVGTFEHQPAPATDPETGDYTPFVTLPFRSSAYAEDRLRKERLPEPPEVGEVVELPGDFTTVSDVEIRRLHSTYHAYLSRATYLLACEESDLSDANNLHDRAYNKLLAASAGGAEHKVTIAKAEANTDEEIVKWKKLVSQHAAVARRLKALVNYYDTSCIRLSREWTMRSGERETAGGLNGNR